MSIYNPISPSNTYVIYDQFGDFFSKSHLEVYVRGWEQAVEQYRFYKEFNPGRSIGLCTKEYYDEKKRNTQSSHEKKPKSSNLAVMENQSNQFGLFETVLSFLVLGLLFILAAHIEYCFTF